MKIILLQDVAKVGRKHEVKDVNDGFARNFLLGQGRALPATPANLAKIEQITKTKIEQNTRTANSVQQLYEILKDNPLVIKVKANEVGHLFASLHEKEIEAEIKKQFGLDVPLNLIKLDQPIKQTGESKIALKLGDLTKEVLIKIETI